MESPIELVRRFCAAWSDNVGAAELAAFFTDDAIYHNIPLAPVTGRQAIANNIASFIRAVDSWSFAARPRRLRELLCQHLHLLKRQNHVSQRQLPPASHLLAPSAFPRRQAPVDAICL